MYSFFIVGYDIGKGVITMRRFLGIGIVVLAIVLLFVRNSNSKEEEIRVRVIPNGNTAEDLKEKEQVKEIVLCYLKIVYDKTYQKCMSNISETYQDLEKSLKSEAFDVDVSFDKHTLYNKTYNDNAIKNEETYVLYVVIGNGKGDNWWGSIYPKFLSVSGDTEIKYESLFMNVVKKIKGK